MATAKSIEVLTALEVNAETGEEIIRDLTADEIAERETMAVEYAARQAEQLARQEALEALIQAQLNA